MSRPHDKELVLGVDIGGTFTDLALLERGGGRLRVGKVLTRHDDLVAGVLAGVRAVLGDAAREAADLRGFVHGTTLATNAIIERRGADTALLVTAGFRDLLLMGRESRYEIYDIEIDLPPPLVPRTRVYEVPERLDAAGAVIRPLEREAVRALARRLAAEGVEAVAVCLLHAYRNAAHEREVAAVFAEEAPGLAVSLSSEVIPDIGEYERASTTAANAYLRPVVGSYLARLESGLAGAGVPVRPLVVTSDGGVIGCDTAVRHPVRLLESGPAGGVRAAEYFGRQTGEGNLIAFDMGGTTAKICVIDNGEPTRSTTFEVARIYRFAKGSGLPLRVPVLEMIEIGAGGGSIAGVDAMGRLRVGPESAGAQPGPAAYGQGGLAPTVTDADLFLGYLNPAFFLGGAMPLHPDRAGQALATGVAEPLGLPLARSAWGVHEIVNQNMARAAKIHCLERGKDPRRYTLVAFGGAGPVHAYRVAMALGMSRVLYPARAGVMSAFGFLVAPPAIELMRADAQPLAGVDPERVEPLFAEMEAEARRLLASGGVSGAGLAVRREAALRHRGQSFELLVPLAPGPMGRGTLAALEDDFHRIYRERYHRVNGEVPLEVAHWRVLVSGPRPSLDLDGAGARGSLAAALKGHRPAYLPESEAFVSCPVYDRYALPAGAVLEGPAIVEEVESTVVVGPQARVEVDAMNNLRVELPHAPQGALPESPARRQVAS